MAAETHPRRGSTAAPSIPPAPPLPPPRRSNILTRFVTQPFTAYGSGSRPSSIHSQRNDASRAGPTSMRQIGKSSDKTQEATHRTGLELSAVDISPDKTHAVIAGRDILKTISVVGGNCAEDDNLRSAILNSKDDGIRQRDAFEIHDVKWSRRDYSSWIATAGTNGKIAIYDLNRADKVVARLHEHNRQVHKLAFNPHAGQLLLSGSHDHNVKLWDLRTDVRHSALTFQGLSGGIRDVRWSPTDGYGFAFGTDEGVVQRWDKRNNKSPKLKINAHDGKAVFSIDWHPDGKHLMSASKDKTVRIWDFASEVRRQKPAFVLRTPYPVHNARWREPCWHALGRDEGAFHCTQIATSYDKDHGFVHIWDFRRPYLPFREIYRYKSGPSDMLWHSRDLLWTVGREGMFTQNDITYAPKVIDRRNMQSVAISPNGELSGFAQRRPLPDRKPSFREDNATLREARDRRASPEKSSFEHITGDDSFDDSFLNTTKQRHHGRTASNRSTASCQRSPAWSERSNEKLMFLTDSLSLDYESLKPHQAAIRGPLPGFFNVQIFTYLATKYKLLTSTSAFVEETMSELQTAFANNAKYAERASMHRNAEMWKIVAHTMSIVMSRRAAKYRSRQSEQQKPLGVQKQIQKPTVKVVEMSSPVLSIKSSIAKKGSNGHLSKSMAIMANGHEHESTSNVATPLARPVPHPGTDSSNAATQLLDSEDEDTIHLPRPIAGPHSVEDHETESARDTLSALRPGFANPQWYGSSGDLNEKRALVGSYRAQPRAPLSLEPHSSPVLSIDVPARVGRHDSNESFAMFSASTESQHMSSVAGSFPSLTAKSHNGGSPAGDRRNLALLGQGNGRGPTFPYAGSRFRDRDNFGSSMGASPSPRTTRALPAVSGSPSLDAAQFSFEKRKATHEMNLLRQHNQLLRHDSSESEALLSVSTDSRLSSRHFEHMEASGTIVPDEPADRSPAPEMRNGTAIPETTALAREDEEASNNLRLVDLLRYHPDLNGDDDLPFTITEMIRSTIQFHVDTLSDAQSASILLLLVAPLLPPIHPATSPDLDALKTAYSESLTTLGMTTSQVHAIKDAHVTQLLQTSINPFQAEAIISTYHTQLHSLGLFHAAASLRRLAYPLYPGVYDHALKDMQSGLVCTKCKNPINNPRDKMHCENCKSHAMPCPICNMKYSAFDHVTKASKKSNKRHKKGVSFDGSKPFTPTATEPSSAVCAPATAEALSTNQHTTHPILWTTCPLCGHGGHTQCMTAWFSDPSVSAGACPTQGCICDCVRGQRRLERWERLREEQAVRERGKVREDAWRVGESRAVKGVGDAVAGLEEGVANDVVKGGRRVRVVEPRGEGRRVGM